MERQKLRDYQSRQAVKEDVGCASEVPGVADVTDQTCAKIITKINSCPRQQQCCNPSLSYSIYECLRIIISIVTNAKVN